MIKLNKKIIIFSCLLICSILGGYFFLSNGGNIPFIQVSADNQKVINETDKKNPIDEMKEIEATGDEQALLDTDTDYKDELMLTDEEISAMANEYDVSKEEIKKNIDHYNYQWSQDHPSVEVKAAYGEEKLIKREYAYNGNELVINDPEVENLQGTEGLNKLASWISKNFNHRLGTATDAEGVLNTHEGDCWGLTDLTKHILLNNGYSFKVLEISTSEANNHRALEVLTEDGWTRFDPSMVTEHYHYKPYYYKVGQVTRVLEVYQ